MSDARHIVERSARRSGRSTEAVIRPNIFAPNRLVESFRLLALNVETARGVTPGQSIVVISAEDDDGRTLIAACLAGALAELGSPVVLVDANPAGSRHAELKVPTPFSPTVLNAYRTLLQHHLPGPGLVASRPEFLEHVKEVMRNATDGGMTAIVDAPACSKSSLAFSLAAGGTGAIYVVRRRVRDRRVHEEVRAQLDRIGARILGLVFSED